MPPPRILHLFAVSALGGSELGAIAYAERQPEFDHRFLFIEPPGAALDRVRDAGFPGASLDTALGGASGAFRAFRRLRATLVREAPALVHAYGLRPSLLMRFAKPRPPLVQAVHSIDAHRPWWQAVLDRETGSRVDRYLVNSEAGAAFLAAERGANRSRIRVVPNGIEVEAVARAETGRDRTRAALGLAPGAPVILTVANLRPPKGLEVLTRTAERLHTSPLPWVWLIAGEGPLATSLAAELAERGLATHVRLLGFRRDVPALLAACDVFCLTSNREGVPVSILEAMAAGKPVVATDVGGVRELVAGTGGPEAQVPGETGLLAPAGDDRALARALAALIADPTRRAAMGAAGRARARASFTLERAAGAIAGVYRELIIGDGPGAGARELAAARGKLRLGLGRRQAAGRFRLHLGAQLRLLVPDVASHDEEDHLLGDVRRVVGDPLEVAGDEQEPRRHADRGRRIDHVGEQVAEELVVKLIDAQVADHHLLGQSRVLAHEGIQAPMDHVAGRHRHLRDVDVGLELRLAVDLDRRLGDVDAQVAHPLEVGHHLEGGGDVAEVGRGGLPQGEDADADLVDLLLEEVDFLVARDDALGLGRVPLDHGRDHQVDQRLDLAGHEEQLVAKLVQLLIELAREVRLPD